MLAKLIPIYDQLSCMYTGGETPIFVFSLIVDWCFNFFFCLNSCPVFVVPILGMTENLTSDQFFRLNIMLFFIMNSLLPLHWNTITCELTGF